MLMTMAAIGTTLRQAVIQLVNIKACIILSKLPAIKSPNKLLQQLLPLYHQNDLILFFQIIFKNSIVSSQNKFEKMNFYGQGSFKIEDSWDKKSNKEKGKARKSSNEGESLMRQLAASKTDPSTDILDDSLSKLIMKDMEHPFNRPKVSKTINPPKVPTPSKLSTRNTEQDKDLVSSMANRLQKLQKTCQNQRNEIKEQREQLQKVKTENAFLKGMKEDSGKAYQQMAILKERNIQLEEKVKQMEEYLKKHGLKWVGNKLEGKLDDKNIKKEIKQSKYAYRLPSQIDFSTIQRRIMDLNSGLESEGFGTEIYSEKGVHKFKKAEHLPMAFYSNGIVIKGYNFYSYKSKQSLRILADLMDGYFPYLFKGKYPNGVLLQPVDKISEQYIKEKKEVGIGGLADSKQRQFEPESKEQFLKRLPDKIIKNGKIIEIKGQINKLFEGNTGGENHENSHHLQNVEGNLQLKTKCYRRLQQNLLEESQICELKVRAEDGKIYFVKMEKTEKIEDVTNQLKKVISGKFKLMSNFPRKEYQGNEQETLQDHGLFPNANLHIQMIK